jgi:bifunctional non-homologous end joining protein LigD
VQSTGDSIFALFGAPVAHEFSETFDAPAAELMAAVRSNGLEGVVAKRRDSLYKPGDRSGAWVKMRANRGQEFVIGGYLPGSTTFDSILVGYFAGAEFIYAARIRAGFASASRQRLFGSFAALSISSCPFRNLPESNKGRWGEGVTAEDMKPMPLAPAAPGRGDRIPRMDAR